MAALATLRRLMNGLHAPAECREDLAAAQGIARRFARELRNDSTAQRRERRAGYGLVIEWGLLVAITYYLCYGNLPWLGKLVLVVPWSLYSSLALDNISHYLNHWPAFTRPFANRLWRASGVLVLFNPREIAWVHRDHHRSYAVPGSGDRVFDAKDRERPFAVWLLCQALGSVTILLPWRPLPPGVARAGRGLRREIRLVRWACLLWVLVLLVLDPADTLLFFLPAVLVVGSFASLVMNLTDHLPGDPDHPFRLATHLTPNGRVERWLSAANHHTAATHLTHHLFPQVHWAHLPALQRCLLPLYERQGAPHSYLVNTTLVGNPWALVRVLRALARAR